MNQSKVLANFILSFLIFIFTSSVMAQNNSGRAAPWKAMWITGPGPQLNRVMIDGGDLLKDFGVFKFRKTFTLETIPQSFVIHVSADNRYKLFVNEQMVSL